MKAISVKPDGTPDGFVPPIAWRVDVSPDGVTRIAVSAGPKVAQVFRALVGALKAPLGVLWVRMVNRSKGKQLGQPERFVAIEKPADQVLEVLGRCNALLALDGRGQLWLRGGFSEQLVLDELGVIYCYPDDPSFRDVLEELGLEERAHANMEDRDYVKVNFSAVADAEEEQLIRELGLALSQ